MRKNKVIFTVAVIVILLLSACSSTTQKTEPFGKPWATSIVIGNYPSESPSVKDDLYTHYNYDLILQHQDSNFNRMSPQDRGFSIKVIKVINDDSVHNHNLDQLRIMFNQAKDIETLRSIGFSEVQPYIDMIDRAGSIDEFNRLLISEDFPFSPFLKTCLFILEPKDGYVAGILPNLMIFDPLYSPGDYYRDSEDPDEQAAVDYYFENRFAYLTYDHSLISITDEELPEIYEKTVGFEKAYAKYLISASDVSKLEKYGAYSALEMAQYRDLDSICADVSSFPVKQLLHKAKMDTARVYRCESEWIRALDGLWTEDNLETIKWIAKIQILAETVEFRDYSLYLIEYEKNTGLPAPDNEIMAYYACDHFFSFDSLLGKIYADYVLGQKFKDRVMEMAENIIRAYKKLVVESTWISEQTRSILVNKLDSMTLNIIEPITGFRDFSGLELVPTEEGGTLFSNYLRVKKYVMDQESACLGQEAFSDLVWHALNTSVENCLYDDMGNSINILPGFVTEALYSDDMSDEELFATLGFSIGHEISHGFDFNGSQFDDKYSSNPIFSGDELDKYLERINKLSDYYSSIEVYPGIYLDGELIKMEAVADLCSAQAIMCHAEQVDGFDYEKFFKSYAQLFLMTCKPEDLFFNLVDPHPISNIRVNVNCQMLDELYEVYGISEGDAMYLEPEKRVRIWGD